MYVWTGGGGSKKRKRGGEHGGRQGKRGSAWERGRGEGRERVKLEKYTCDSEESPETREVVSTSVSSGGISTSVSSGGISSSIS